MFQFIIYRIGLFLVLNLSLKSAYSLAKFISGAQYLLSRRDRNIVKNNLRAIFPEKTKAQIRAMSRQVFINFGKYLADFLRFSKIDKEFIKRNIKIEGLRYVDEALKQGKGVIVISAHIGNWELAGAAMGILGYDVVAVVLRHADNKVNNFFNRQRETKNMHVTTVGKAARACLRALKENKLIALVLDRDFTGHGMVVDFLNKKAMIPKGAAVFHLKTSAPIIPAFLVRCENDTFKFIFEPPFKFNLSGDKERDTEMITRECTALAEKYIRAYPEQWFMFRRYWVA